ncbi:MAG TPA: IMP dehydrogenase, partial [Candidatus Paceibacterota bacterium]|nr:IMP dehydrogenase [Candidatus Paceibacterota bacterium]
IKNPADLTKAIGAGANTIMSGYLFAGTQETPGEIMEKNGKKFKIYRGSASYDVSVKKAELDGNKDKEIISVEGEKTIVPYKGPIELIVKKFLGGLASGMTYIGAKEMKNIIGKADFNRVTSAGVEEGRTHGVFEENCF